MLVIYVLLVNLAGNLICIVLCTHQLVGVNSPLV